VSDSDARTERGLDVLSTLSGSAEGGRALARHFEGQGALGGLALPFGAGEIWSRPGLSRRDRSLVVISLLAALARDVELRMHVAGGLNHGLRPDEIDEILLQLGLYAGLPFALAGARIAAEVFAERDGAAPRGTPPAASEPKGDAQRRADGLDALRTLLGMHAGAEMAPIAEATLAQLGEMGRLVIDVAFGEVWSRPQLSRRDRSLVVISVLTALSLVDELDTHLRGALHHGVTPAEIEEVMLTAVVYAGFPRAIFGLARARQAFAAIGGGSP
jgi:4-carboxymuconolactone decarboxylase